MTGSLRRPNPRPQAALPTRSWNAFAVVHTVTRTGRPSAVHPEKTLGTPTLNFGKWTDVIPETF